MQVAHSEVAAAETIGRDGGGTGVVAALDAEAARTARPGDASIRELVLCAELEAGRAWAILAELFPLLGAVFGRGGRGGLARGSSSVFASAGAPEVFENLGKVAGLCEPVCVRNAFTGRDGCALPKETPFPAWGLDVFAASASARLLSRILGVADLLSLFLPGTNATGFCGTSDCFAGRALLAAKDWHSFGKTLLSGICSATGVGV